MVKYSYRLPKKTVKLPSLIVFKNRLETHLPANGVSAVDSALRQGNRLNGHLRFLQTQFCMIFSEKYYAFSLLEQLYLRE